MTGPRQIELTIRGPVAGDRLPSAERSQTATAKLRAAVRAGSRRRRRTRLPCSGRGLPCRLGSNQKMASRPLAVGDPATRGFSKTSSNIAPNAVFVELRRKRLRTPDSKDGSHRAHTMGERARQPTWGRVTDRGRTARVSNGVAQARDRDGAAGGWTLRCGMTWTRGSWVHERWGRCDDRCRLVSVPRA